MESNERILREQLATILRGGEAHGNVADAIRSFPAELASLQVPESPHTPWRLLEHMRIAQWDILQFCKNPGHVSPEFPGGYWPEGDAPPDPAAWDQAVSLFCKDLESMQELVMNPDAQLFAPIPHGQRQTILREALLVSDHNSFHLGQMSIFWRRDAV